MTDEVMEKNWQGRKCVFVIRAEITQTGTMAEAEKQTKNLKHIKKQYD